MLVCIVVTGGVCDIKGEAQTLEVGRWVMSLGLCGSDELPPLPNINLLFLKMRIIAPFGRVAMRIKENAVLGVTLNYTWYQ